MNWQLQSNNDDNKGIKFNFVHVGKVCKLDKKTNYSLGHGDLNLHGSKIMHFYIIITINYYVIIYNNSLLGTHCKGCTCY